VLERTLTIEVSRRTATLLRDAIGAVCYQAEVPCLVTAEFLGLWGLLGVRLTAAIRGPAGRVDSAWSKIVRLLEGV
jgi:hypothetical protein